MIHETRTGSQSTGDWIVSAVKSNPEGMLLLAAGCALLLRSGSSSRRAGSQSSSYGPSRQYIGGQTQRAASDLKETMSQAADTAREYATDVGKAVSDKASSYASAVGEYADEARRTISNESERLVEQARTTFQGTVSRVLEDQPLAVAVAGLAAGAMVAAAFPTTSAERRTLGPAGERLAEAATSAGQHLSEAASKAGERLKNVAEEKGLNADGLKEVASDVAGAFGSALRGEENKRTGSSSGSGGNQSSPGATSQPGASRESGTGAGQGGTQHRMTPKPGGGNQF